MTPDSSVKTLRGVGETRAKALQNMGIRTLRDLLYHFPRAYENRGHIRRLTEGTDGVKSAFLLTVGSVPKTVRLRGRMTLTKFKAFDDSGSVDIVFYNQEYVRQVFEVGETYRFWGKLTYSKSWSLSSPAYEPAPEGKVLPDFISVYSLGNGVNRKLIESLIASALACPIPDFLPEEIRLRYHFPTLSRALKSVHAPASREELDAGLRRLIFDELFCYSLAVSSNRQREQVKTTAPCAPVDMSPFYALLPYELTGAQKRVISEIVTDMTATDKTPMHRILIGDVGSGKTVCAMAAIYLAVKNGYQAALMAPTEILANQHYQDFLPFFERLGFSCACLTGSTSQREKKTIYARLSAPENDLQIVVGTHALLGDKVCFSKLGLVITDEQHRFGIR
ncbi:MAG: DEAD/DEAH box helicase, partial [Eubacteriales bacterium]